MAKVIGPDFIALQVRDLATARVFYTDLLGLEIEPRHTTPTFLVFATQPIPFGVREPSPGVNLDAVNQVGAGMVLWLNCDDVDTLYARLQSNGVPIVDPLQDSPFGRYFVCRDPEGYELVLFKAIPLDDVRLDS